MTDHEIYKKMDKLVSEMELDSKQKSQMCSFRMNGGDRYCSATTNKTCRKCKLFTPTINTKIRMVVEDSIGLEEDIDQLTREKNILDEHNEELSRENRSLRHNLFRKQRKERLVKRRFGRILKGKKERMAKERRR